MTDGAGRDTFVGSSAEQTRLSELLPRSLEDALDDFQDQTEQQPQQICHKFLDLEVMQVVVRIRPVSVKGASGVLSQTCVHAVCQNSLAIAAPVQASTGSNSERTGKSFMFSAVFDASATQQEFFNQTARPMVVSVLSREKKECAMLAYGTSSSGKTHTMEGTKSDPGIVLQALQLILKDARQHGCRQVSISRYEVYNERIYDLLDDGPVPLEGKRHLEVKETVHGKVFIEGLSKAAVTDWNQAMDLLRKSSKQRRKAATSLNYTSSRSHCVLAITLEWGSSDDTQSQQDSSISFIDLAGSERVKATGNTGERLGESKAINSSLMTLRCCLENLHWNQRHSSLKPRQLPHRESKITHIFRDLLHGWGSMIFCINVSPLASDFDSTIKVLQYATMAAHIGMAAKHGAPKREYRAKSPNLRPQKRHRMDLQASTHGNDIDQQLHADKTCQAAAVKELSRKLDDLEDINLDLRHEVSHLTAELAQEREQRATAETDIREHVAAEMEELLRDMQASYKDRLALEMAQLERRLRQESGPGSISNLEPITHTNDLSLPCTRCSALETEMESLQEECEDLSRQSKAAVLREAELAEELLANEAQLQNMQHLLEQAQRLQERSTEQQAQRDLQHSADLALHQLQISSLQSRLDLTGQDLRETQEREQQALSKCHELESTAATLRDDKQAAALQITEIQEKLLALQQEAQQQSLEHAAQMQNLQAKNIETLESASRQFKANTDAEREMLESQLERAAKEKAALQQRLQLALNCTPNGETGGHSMHLAPTPHFVALARAQQGHMDRKEDNQKHRGQPTRLRPAIEAAHFGSPAFSPAIQWTATPDACQIVCGKLPSRLAQASEHIEAKQGAVELKSETALDTCTSETITQDLPAHCQGPSDSHGAVSQIQRSTQPTQISTESAEADKPQGKENADPAKQAVGRVSLDGEANILKEQNGPRKPGRPKRARQKQAAAAPANPPVTRRRRLLDPTPLKVRMALGQEDADEDCLLGPTL